MKTTSSPLPSCLRAALGLAALVALAGAWLASPAWAADAGAENAVAEDRHCPRLCVVLGDAKGELAVKLARETELLIYVQVAEPSDGGRARSWRPRRGCTVRGSTSSRAI